MITPQEIAKKAERKYREVLRAWLAGEDIFPIEFPAGKPAANLAARRDQIDALRDNSKEVKGFGYEIDWQTINKRDLGVQTTPTRIRFPGLEDYLSFTGKRREFEHFVTDASHIREHFPALQDWLYHSPQDVIQNHGIWADLLVVCDYFCEHPQPNVYIRELPIPVHTKFIEQNDRVLSSLLYELLPPDWIKADEKTFTSRFGLKDKSPLVRFRLLDNQMIQQYGLPIEDVSLPVEQFNHLLTDQLQPRHIIIVENLINFLTLPPLPDSIGLLGGGFAVHVLRDVSCLNQTHVIYWGDIDAHGFQILSGLRGLFPDVQSLMMDQATLDDHAEHIVPGNKTRTDLFEGLTSAETNLVQYVLAQNLRLEQEHIPHSYAVERLVHAITSDT